MHIFISQPYDDFAFQKDLNFNSKSFPIQFKSLPFKPQFEFEYSNQFSKTPGLKSSQKVI
jgi:hypothetical protein